MTYLERWGHLRTRTNKRYFQARREHRRKEADERNLAWRALTNQEKLSVLANRPGNCVKQISKLTQ